MKYFLGLMFLFLAGCNTPGPHFRDVSAVRVSVGGSIFDVRVRGDLAEAMRMNRQYAPRLSGIAPLAEQAMQHVSGCRVTQIRGDPALMIGLLDCGDGGHSAAERRAAPQFDCYPVDHWRNAGLGYETTVFDCDTSL